MAFELTDFNRNYVPRGEFRGLFNTARYDEDNINPRYYAFYNEAGSYIIQKVETGSTGKICTYYAKAKMPTQLDTDWINRASLTYLEYYQLF